MSPLAGAAGRTTSPKDIGGNTPSPGVPLLKEDLSSNLLIAATRMQGSILDFTLLLHMGETQLRQDQLTQAPN
jgi:hypothetical protein